jgi:ribonuclease J
VPSAIASSSDLRIVPLGGLGEIGMNCLALEHQDGVLVVDCGTSFPPDDYGVDVIRPDFRFLEECAPRIVGVFLTHGHEDHIGAVPHLLSSLSVPVYGPAHTLSLVRRRLDEHGFEPDATDLRVATPGKHYSLGPFDVEPIRVAHSIIESSALAIRSSAGMVVHTGDFDFDPDPTYGEPTDQIRLTNLGDSGVDLLLSDSTNVDIPDREGSERSVGLAIERLVQSATQRVFIGLFASNVQRLSALGALAQRLERKLCLLGRSLNTQMQVGHELGCLKWPSDLLIAPEQLRDYPRERVLVLVGGTQAERSSAMYRLAKNNHRWIEVERGDVVLFSSRAIPGNERPIHEIVCDLMRLGAIVHTRQTDPDIHVSGHASRAELRQMIELIRPSAFVPVHGTLHHLCAHAELARETGLQQTSVIENGSTLRFCSGTLSPMDPAPCGRIAIDIGGTPLKQETLLDRVELGRQGLALVSLVIGEGGSLIVPPTVTLRGVPLTGEQDSTSRAVALEVARVARNNSRRHCPLEDDVRRAVRRVVADLTGCRPSVDVHAIHVGEQTAAFGASCGRCHD